MFSLEMVKNSICFWGVSKQNAFFKRCALKKRTHAPLYRIRPELSNLLLLEKCKGQIMSKRVAVDYDFFVNFIHNFL